MRDPGIPPRERLETTSALASVALILGLLSGSPAGAWAALGILLVSLFLPVPAAWAVRGWKTVTHGIAKVLTAVLLGAVHLCVVTPMGLLRRLARRDPTREGAFLPADEPADGPRPDAWDRPG